MSERASFLIRASAAFAKAASCHYSRSGVAVVLASSQAVTMATSDNSGPRSENRNEKDDSANNEDKNWNLSEPKEGNESERSGKSVIEAIGEQVTFGGTLGFATGYAIRTLAKPLLFFLGTEVILMQYMAYRQWVTVHWDRIGKDIRPNFSRSTAEGLLDILVYRMPFSASFTAGLVAGLRLSTTPSI